MSHVDGLSYPVLLQGDEELVVPPSHSEMFRAALEAELSFYGQVFGFETPGVPALALEGPPISR